jgi:hypothetical protein
MRQAMLDREPSRRMLQWRRYDRTLAGAIVAAIVVLGIGVHAWLNGERLFAGPGATQTTPVPIGHTLYVGLGPFLRDGKPDADTRIRLRSIAPLATENTAGATVNILECEAGATDAGAGLIAGGVVFDDVAKYCPTVEPVRVGTITVGPRANGFVLAITPRHSGIVRVDGARMNYRVGIRNGRQRIGAVTLTANTP